MKKTHLTFYAAVATLALATTALLLAEPATTPSQNYPGNGSSKSFTTNASPEALNPTTGQQSTPPGQTSPSQIHGTHNQ